MDCSNCGNLVALGEVCVTCGTLAVEEAVVVSETAGTHSEPTGQNALLVALAAGGLVVVGVLAGVLLFSASGSESSDVVAVRAPSTSLAVPADDTTATSAVVTTSGGSTDWRAADVDGALPPFDSPERDQAVGQASPTVQGSDFDGAGVTIEDDGHPKVIVFLAHWCPHCQREVPALQEFLDANGIPEGVELISVATSISADRPNHPPDVWLDREGWSVPVIVDPDGAVAEAFGLTAFPYYVFVREDFTVDFRISGELDPALVFDFTATLFGPGPERVALGPAGYAEAAAQPTACGGEAPPAPSDLSFSEPGEAPRATTLTFVTSCGDVVVELDAVAAPETVNSMLFLAANGYFDGTVCHRLVPGFVLQCGDPTATGIGTPGYLVADEFPENSDGFVPGAVAMANAGPGTTGSQFFIVIGDATFLPPQFTLIGTITDVAPLVAALETVSLGSSSSGEVSAPLETIYIESVTIGG